MHTQRSLYNSVEPAVGVTHGWPSPGNLKFSVRRLVYDCRPFYSFTRSTSLWQYFHSQIFSLFTVYDFALIIGLTIYYFFKTYNNTNIFMELVRDHNMDTISYNSTYWNLSVFNHLLSLCSLYFFLFFSVFFSYHICRASVFFFASPVFSQFPYSFICFLLLTHTFL